jgi:hypothetical protein
MPRTRGEPQLLVGALDAEVASRLVGAASDMTLVLDDEGTILEVMVKGDDDTAKLAGKWRGRAWSQTVTTDSLQKIEALLRDAQVSAEATQAINKAAASTRWRQVNHPISDSEDLPFLYSTVQVAARSRTHPKGRIVAFGRDLRSLVALQRRLVETQQTTGARARQKHATAICWRLRQKPSWWSTARHKKCWKPTPPRVCCVRAHAASWWAPPWPACLMSNMQNGCKTCWLQPAR